MKKQLCIFSLIIILGFNSCGQNKINKLINDNLKSRYTNIEIVSITPDSCPDMRNLFHLSMSLRVISSECKLNIIKAFVSYSEKKISLEKTNELCQKEIDRINNLAKSWDNAYNSKSEKCLLIQYRYGNSDGIKTTLTDYYSLDETRYKEGNYPFLQKEYDAFYGFNFYKDVSNKYKELLLDVANE